MVLITRPSTSNIPADLRGELAGLRRIVGERDERLTQKQNIINRMEAQLLEAQRSEDQSSRLLTAVRKEFEEVSKEKANQVRNKEEEANTLRRENVAIRSENETHLAQYESLRHEAEDLRNRNQTLVNENAALREEAMMRMANIERERVDALATAAQNLHERDNMRAQAELTLVGLRRQNAEVEEQARQSILYLCKENEAYRELCRAGMDRLVWLEQEFEELGRQVAPWQRIEQCEFFLVVRAENNQGFKVASQKAPSDPKEFERFVSIIIEATKKRPEFRLLLGNSPRILVDTENLAQAWRHVRLCWCVERSVEADLKRSLFRVVDEIAAPEQVHLTGPVRRGTKRKHHPYSRPERWTRRRRIGKEESNENIYDTAGSVSGRQTPQNGQHMGGGSPRSEDRQTRREVVHVIEEVEEDE